MGMTIEELKQKMIPVLRAYGVERAGVCGSVARGEDTPASDVDVLVQFREPIGLFKFSRLQRELGEQVQKKVDLATYRSLRRAFKERMLQDEVRIV